MAYPNTRQLDDALLSLIGNTPDGRVTPAQARDSLALYFRLTEDELKRTHQNSNDNKWRTDVAFARQDLVEKGLVSKEERGVWRITDKGKEEVARISHLGVPLVTPAPSLDAVAEAEAEASAELRAKLDSVSVKLEELEQSFNQRPEQGTISQTAVQELRGVIEQLGLVVADVNNRVQKVEEGLLMEQSGALLVRVGTLERDLIRPRAAIEELAILQTKVAHLEGERQKRDTNKQFTWQMAVAILSLIIAIAALFLR